MIYNKTLLPYQNLCNFAKNKNRTMKIEYDTFLKFYQQTIDKKKK